MRVRRDVSVAGAMCANIICYCGRNPFLSARRVLAEFSNPLSLRDILLTGGTRRCRVLLLVYVELLVTIGK